MGRPTRRIWLGHHVLATTARLDAQDKLEWAHAFLDGSFVPAKKGRGVGLTKVGQGSKVRVIAEGNGLPIGLHVDSAQPHELTLAKATLATIRMPQRQGRPRTPSEGVDRRQEL
ncbi:MAG: hypothetical protein RMN52_12150 [Anaerolineae bacterium]|nr:hypothetical protein [Candidatus Roseilinea sp.]MDW8450743.1 hypothetical protein [Anaerolineae bacterium]